MPFLIYPARCVGHRRGRGPPNCRQPLLSEPLGARHVGDALEPGVALGNTQAPSPSYELRFEAAKTDIVLPLFGFGLLPHPNIVETQLLQALRLVEHGILL